MSQYCSRCRTPLEAGFVTVRYQGSGRRLVVRLKNVPTPMCPECRKPAVAPEAWERLLHLGLGPGNGWEMKVEPIQPDAA